MRFKLDEKAFPPERAHPKDAGLDLRSPISTWIEPNSHKMIDTGVHAEIPAGFVGLLTSKSGLMLKGIVSSGTIDSGYTGSIGAVLYNHSNEGYHVSRGDKITQLVVFPISLAKVELVEELEETERGDSGFGSTGK